MMILSNPSEHIQVSIFAVIRSSSMVVIMVMGYLRPLLRFFPTATYG